MHRAPLRSLPPPGVCRRHIVDLFVTFDGAPQQHAHICYGDAGKSNEEAIAYAELRGLEPAVIDRATHPH